MKMFTMLTPVFQLIKNFGFLYRMIALVMCFVFFSSNIKDLKYVATANEITPHTVEELASKPKSEIPRYLRLRDIGYLGDTYVATENEDSGEILDASYPVYSAEQLLSAGSGATPESITAHILVKDKDFNESDFTMATSVDGLYDNESFTEVRDILVANGYKVSANAILLVKERPPSLKSTLLWTLISGMGGLLILLSFVPNSVYQEPLPPTELATS